MNTGNEDDTRTLELLSAIESGSAISQRDLASRLGIALGLANAYLKRCVRKGLVKIQAAPANRYFYYLTPQGFKEKSRLTGKYLSSSLSFYQLSKGSYEKLVSENELNSETRVIFCGATELAEIAMLSLWGTEVEIVGIYDPDATVSSFLGKPVWMDIPSGDSFDYALMTSLKRPVETHSELLKLFGPKKVLAPDILRLDSHKPSP